jgi:hypothetical protein
MQVEDIATAISELLQMHRDVLQITANEQGDISAKGTFKVMQGKQEVDGYYFASTVKKTKDVRFYFFPIYTHPEAFELSEQMKKMLKGKSCFHLSKWNDAMREELRAMIASGVSIYRASGLI